MLPSLEFLRSQLEATIIAKNKQGHDVAGLAAELSALPSSYDAFDAFMKRLANLPIRPDWPYVEPSELHEIWDQCDSRRPLGRIGSLTQPQAAERAKAAFLGAVAGCILGKPLEVVPITLAEIRKAAEAVGEWPLKDYVSVPLLESLGKRNDSWHHTTKGRINYVAPDDDINYNIVAMLAMEQKGFDFTKDDLIQLWIHNLPVYETWGPERSALIKAAIHSLGKEGVPMPIDEWVKVWNPNDELCGAAIRADAYGYACPGYPAKAAELAWRDASWTHRRTGIYGAMFIAAAIAAAFVEKDRAKIFEIALQFVPQKSRFHEITLDCLNMVRGSKDYLAAYEQIHGKYCHFGSCQIFAETGTLINSVYFAESVHDGFCKQVSQGYDTDCYGEFAGSICGAYFGPGHLDENVWLRPFSNELRTYMADFYERSLSAVTERMGNLTKLAYSAT